VGHASLLLAFARCAEAHDDSIMASDRVIEWARPMEEKQEEEEWEKMLAEHEIQLPE
jgi:hypothetical protein